MDRRQWDERYATDELVWRADPNRFLVEEVAGLPVGSALDVACGEGRNAVWLAERGWEVTGVDFSPVALGKGRRLAEHQGVEVALVEADVTSWTPPREAFDLIVVLYLHLPADARRRVLTAQVPALRRGGTLLVVGHDATNPAQGFGGPQDPAILYTAQDLAHEVGGLVVERAEAVERPVDTAEGPRVAIDALLRAKRVA
jgi:SAM-dependent methyltransferase